MRIQASKLIRQTGFTLAETMIALGVTAIAGAAVGYITLNATVLYAKNTADNAAHDQNRIAISRLVRDIHSATSIPQLGKIVPGNLAANPTAPVGSWTPYGTNVTFWAESGAGPAAGISFKKMGSATNPNGGPFKMRNDPGNKDMIQIDSGNGNPPFIGTELIFPYYGMEGTITKVTSNGANHYNVWVKGGLETRIKEKKNTTIICYYMSRYAYVVENGELKFYASTPPPAGITWPIVVARNIIEPPRKDPIEVNVRNDRYQPDVMTIKRGETVNWRWKEDPLRSVTSKAPHPYSGQFNSGLKGKDAEWSRTFNEAGVFSYTSSNNSAQTATITVIDRDFNAKPFGQTSSQYVTVNLTTEDKHYTNRNYRSVNSLLAGSVPIRAQISKTQ